MKTPKYYITIPNGKRVTLGNYVAAWQKLKTLNPESEVSDWEWFPVTVADVLREMSRAVHDRINKRAELKTKNALRP